MKTAIDKQQLESLARTLRVASEKGLVSAQELQQVHSAFIAYDHAGTPWSVGVHTGKWNHIDNGSWVPGEPPSELYIEDSIRARIDDLGGQLHSTEAPARGAANACPQCGHPVAVGKKFCTHCGATVTQRRVEAPSATPTEHRCPNPECSRPVPPDKRFCTSCGTPIA